MYCALPALLHNVVSFYSLAIQLQASHHQELLPHVQQHCKAQSQHHVGPTCIGSETPLAYRLAQVNPK